MLQLPGGHVRECPWGSDVHRMRVRNRVDDRNGHRIDRVLELRDREVLCGRHQCVFKLRVRRLRCCHGHVVVYAMSSRDVERKRGVNRFNGVHELRRGVLFLGWRQCLLSLRRRFFRWQHWHDKLHYLRCRHVPYYDGRVIFDDLHQLRPWLFFLGGRLVVALHDVLCGGVCHVGRDDDVFELSRGNLPRHIWGIDIGRLPELPSGDLLVDNQGVDCSCLYRMS